MGFSRQPTNTQWWVAIPFSRGSSQPRDWTWISSIAGGFFAIWATREKASEFLKAGPKPRGKYGNWSFHFKDQKLSTSLTSAFNCARKSARVEDKLPAHTPFTVMAIFSVSLYVISFRNFNWTSPSQPEKLWPCFISEGKAAGVLIPGPPRSSGSHASLPNSSPASALKIKGLLGGTCWWSHGTYPVTPFPGAIGINSPYYCTFQREVSRRVQENLLHLDREMAKWFCVPEHPMS